jgi:uncharacterized protein YkwD
MMTAGVTATLHAGVLSVVGTSPSAPIVVDIQTALSHRKPVGAIFVEGVAAFKASQVRKITISEVVGESVTVNRSRKWNPVIHVAPPTSIVTASLPPPTLPPVISISPTPPANTTTPPATGVAGESAAELQIVAAVNVVRGMNGLAPLTLDAKLVQMAHIQANAMAQFQTMSHELPQAAQPTLLDRANFVGYQFFSLGENIAFNFPDTGSVMQAWMNSPGHRANILNPSYTQIGVGIAFDTNGDPYYSQEFGQPMS